MSKKKELSVGDTIDLNSSEADLLARARVKGDVANKLFGMACDYTEESSEAMNVFWTHVMNRVDLPVRFSLKVSGDHAVVDTTSSVENNAIVYAKMLEIQLARLKSRVKDQGVDVDDDKDGKK